MQKAYPDLKKFVTAFPWHEYRLSVPVEAGDSVRTIGHLLLQTGGLDDFMDEMVYLTPSLEFGAGAVAFWGKWRSECPRLVQVLARAEKGAPLGVAERNPTLYRQTLDYFAMFSDEVFCRQMALDPSLERTASREEVLRQVFRVLEYGGGEADLLADLGVRNGWRNLLWAHRRAMGRGELMDPNEPLLLAAEALIQDWDFYRASQELAAIPFPVCQTRETHPELYRKTREYFEAFSDKNLFSVAKVIEVTTPFQVEAMTRDSKNASAFRERILEGLIEWLEATSSSNSRYDFLNPWLIDVPVDSKIITQAWTDYHQELWRASRPRGYF